MNEITKPQAETLARFLLTLRPDWSITYTLPAVERMRLLDSDVEHITRAAVRGALARRQGKYVLAKPDVLAMAGEHWKARMDEQNLAIPPSAIDCDKCRRTHMPNVDCVREGWSPRVDRKTEHVQQLKAALREATADLCSHGVDPRSCKDHREPVEEAS